MTLFAVIAPEGSEKLSSSMERQFPGKNFEFSPGQFVAVGSGLTTQQVAAAIGAEGEVGRFVVFLVNSHWGYHRKDLWEWLTVNSPG